VVLGDDDREWTSKLKARNRSERIVHLQESAGKGLSVWISHDQGDWEIYKQRTRVLRMKGPVVAILVDFTSAVRGPATSSGQPARRTDPRNQRGGPVRRDGHQYGSMGLAASRSRSTTHRDEAVPNSLPRAISCSMHAAPKPPTSRTGKSDIRHVPFTGLPVDQPAPGVGVGMGRPPSSGTDFISVPAAGVGTGGCASTG
jgi:hypothetical protein